MVLHVQVQFSPDDSHFLMCSLPRFVCFTSVYMYLFFVDLFPSPPISFTLSGNTLSLWLLVFSFLLCVCTRVFMRSLSCHVTLFNIDVDFCRTWFHFRAREGLLTCLFCSIPGCMLNIPTSTMLSFHQIQLSSCVTESHH